MKNNMIVYRELNNELNELSLKIKKLSDFKYGDVITYLKLGSEMCCLLDIQLQIMKSYQEVLLSRMTLLRKYMSEEINYE